MILIQREFANTLFLLNKISNIELMGAAMETVTLEEPL